MWTSTASVACMIPERGDLGSISRAARPRCNAVNMLKTAWQTSVSIFASNDFCTRPSSFNVEGSKTAVYCKQHAEEGVGNVRSNGCMHDSCARQSEINFEGGKKAAFRKQHAEESVVNVRLSRCSHYSCVSISIWGVMADVSSSVCVRQNGDFLGEHGIDFKASHLCARRWVVANEGNGASTEVAYSLP